MGSAGGYRGLRSDIKVLKKMETGLCISGFMHFE